MTPFEKPSLTATKTEPFTVEVFYFDAGGGHRNAAEAMERIIGQLRPDWRVVKTHLQDVLEDKDLVKRADTARKKLSLGKTIAARKKFRSEDLYNAYLKSGFTYASRAGLRGLQYGIALVAPLLETRLVEHFTTQPVPPDAVLFLLPNFQIPAKRAFHTVYGDSRPFIVAMTDFADCGKDFWLTKPLDTLICGSDKAVAQAKAFGYRLEDTVFRISGMIVKPEFYRPPMQPGAPTLGSLGLDPTVTTVLVGFGGNPPLRLVMQVLQSLDAADLPLQAIVMCGHNEKLLQTLRGRPRCYAAPHTKHLPPSHDMVAFIDLADIAVGKPGPGFISEAWQRGKPVVVERSARTLYQERYNTELVEQLGAGAVIKSFRQAGPAIGQAFRSGALDAWRDSVARMNNRGGFEVTLILEHLMRAARQTEYAAQSGAYRGSAA